MHANIAEALIKYNNIIQFNEYKDICSEIAQVFLIGYMIK